MIDTITLQLKGLKIDEKYLSRFDTLTSSKSKTRRYIFNPDIQKDGYLPKITIKNLQGYTDWYTENVEIEGSVSKMLYGTNYYGNDENDYEPLIKRLLEMLNSIFSGSPITRWQLEQSNLRTIAFVFNFILPNDFGNLLEFIKKISLLDVGKNYKKVRNDIYNETEIGCCVRFYNKQVSIKIYAKTAQLMNEPKKTQEEEELVRKIEQGILPSKILRIEITLQNRTSLKKYFATKTDGDAKRERYLKEAFNNKLCQSILLEFFNKLANEVNVQALNTPLYPIVNCLKTIKEAGMYPYDAYAWLGRSLVIQQAGSLQLKLINDDYFSRQDRSRVDKKLKKLLNLYPFPFFTLKKVFDECRKQLNEFKVMKPEGYS
jgi:hypothetical protein